MCLMLLVQARRTFGGRCFSGLPDNGPLSEWADLSATLQPAAAQTPAALQQVVCWAEVVMAQYDKCAAQIGGHCSQGAEPQVLLQHMRPAT